MGDLKVYKGFGQAKYKNHQLNIHKPKSVSVNFLCGICKCNMNSADVVLCRLRFIKLSRKSL